MPTSIKSCFCKVRDSVKEEKYCISASDSGLCCLQESSDRVGMLVPLSSRNMINNNRVIASSGGMENSFLFICLFIFSSFHKNSAVEQDKVDLKNYQRSLQNSDQLANKEQSSLRSVF